MIAQDLTGKQIHYWTVLGRGQTTPSAHTTWKCRCVCGFTKDQVGTDLLKGRTKSCGCKRGLNDGVPRVVVVDGKKQVTPEYLAWRGIKIRCLNPGSKSYPAYGGRGITICDEWRSSFASFYKSVGPRPSKHHSIDRIDNNGNYEPGNCKWSTPKEQSANRRNTPKVNIRGVVRSATEWDRIAGLNPGVVRNRIKFGWRSEDLLNPSRNKAKRRQEAHS